MSLKYEILKWGAKAIDLKHFWSAGSVDELLEKKRKFNAKNKIPDLQDPDFIISRIEVMGFPVLKFIHKKKSKEANLYIIGTGMTAAPAPKSVKQALKLAKETGLDLYVPYYPLCTDYPLTKAYQMIYATYQEMLKDYSSDHISVLGYSSGGNLALGLVSYINVEHPDASMPNHIWAISPGTCVGSDEEWQVMQEIDKKDLTTPATYMKIAEEIMRHGDDNVPDYMLWLQKGIYTHCPKVTFIYGSDECLYASYPGIEEKMKQYGVEYQLIVGEGMFHCYPLFPLCKEAKDGWDMLIKMMKVR